ncbi:MAG: D-aminoacyl-tRNA deacylase [Alphaproteobacteria bacterium]|nr:D-aminoacyl-tRNA deacylase [Alphaproteobacteria bacterium]
MKAVIQRVTQASVHINNTVYSEIDAGFLILLGIEQNDTNQDLDLLIKKISTLRIFNDDNGRMNLDLHQIQGNILIVSQFTLCANLSQGNRPSFVHAAKPEIAREFYTNFIEKMEILFTHKVKSGCFGADMKVHLVNDGPVTIIIDTKTLL